MKIITAAAQLAELADELGVSKEWHEPDNQGVTARVEGLVLDNAGFWPTQPDWSTERAGYAELHVIIAKDGEDVAAVNLATVLAMASFPHYWATSPRVSS